MNVKRQANGTDWLGCRMDMLMSVVVRQGSSQEMLESASVCQGHGMYDRVPTVDMQVRSCLMSRGHASTNLL